LWLSEIDTLLKAQAHLVGASKFGEDDKLTIAESYLEDKARRQYNVKVMKSGQFETYDLFKKWMLDFYAPPDVILAHRDTYNSMKQRQDESVDQYYLRFSEAVSNLDDPPTETWQVSDFIRGLQTHSAKYLASFVDLVDFKNITVEQVNERLTRAIRLGTGRGNGSGGSDGNSSGGRSGGTSGRESEFPEQRVSKNSKQKFKRQSQPSSKGKSTLTSDQKRRVEELLRKDGGEFVGQAIRENSEWYALSTEKNVCRNCAAKGHIARDCPLGSKKSRKGGSGNLNAILSGLARIEKAMNVGNSTDYQYLCSLAEDVPLAMFPCTIAGSSLGVALLDDGATRNYVSLAYAKRARLRIQELSSKPKPIRLPNGQRMKVHGMTEFELEISVWRGKVQATVLELQADFDVVLGMEWHREWEPIPDWKKLEFSIETKQGTYTYSPAESVVFLRSRPEKYMDLLPLSRKIHGFMNPSFSLVNIPFQIT